MHTAAREWQARVEARNALALCAVKIISYEPRPLRCDAAPASMTTPDGEGAVATQTGKEVAA